MAGPMVTQHSPVTEAIASMVVTRHGVVHAGDVIAFVARSALGTRSISIEVSRTVRTLWIGRCADAAVVSACRALDESGVLEGALHGFDPVEWDDDDDETLTVCATDAGIFADLLLVLRDAALGVVAYADGYAARRVRRAAEMAMARDPFFPSDLAVQS